MCVIKYSCTPTSQIEPPQCLSIPLFMSTHIPQFPFNVPYPPLWSHLGIFLTTLQFSLALLHLCGYWATFCIFDTRKDGHR